MLTQALMELAALPGSQYTIEVKVPHLPVRSLAGAALGLEIPIYWNDELGNDNSYHNKCKADKDKQYNVHLISKDLRIKYKIFEITYVQKVRTHYFF